MRLFSYNVNGIRAALRKGFLAWLQHVNPDIICLQEIKATVGQLDLSIFENLGYYVYWYPAERKGYSGVAILSRYEARQIQYGLPHYNQEGRLISLIIKNLHLVNVYLPSGSMGQHRQAVKYRWLDIFYDYLQDLKRGTYPVIACGDFNICHKDIDIHNPIANAKSSGFLPKERAWMSKLLSQDYIDSFRILYPQEQAYTWWSYRFGAKAKNLGWRIDYFIISQDLESHLKHASILPEVNFSDHCPIAIELTLE